jgi:hypothetical protein
MSNNTNSNNDKNRKTIKNRKKDINRYKNNNNNSIQFFIISVLHQQTDGQLQLCCMHKRKIKIINTTK